MDLLEMRRWARDGGERKGHSTWRIGRVDNKPTRLPSETELREITQQHMVGHTLTESGRDNNHIMVELTAGTTPAERLAFLMAIEQAYIAGAL